MIDTNKRWVAESFTDQNAKLLINVVSIWESKEMGRTFELSQEVIEWWHHWLSFVFWGVEKWFSSPTMLSAKFGWLLESEEASFSIRHWFSTGISHSSPNPWVIDIFSTIVRYCCFLWGHIIPVYFDIWIILVFIL